MQPLLGFKSHQNGKAVTLTLGLVADYVIFGLK
jgi:hypothetical protein